MKQATHRHAPVGAVIDPSVPKTLSLAESVLFAKGQMLPSRANLGFCPKGAAVKDIDALGASEDEKRWQGNALRVFGPFRATRKDGLDVTPGGALRQAILAVLATSTGQIRARKVLQDMFWGHETVERASANLRTAIYQLRQDLRSLGPDLLLADRHAISLAPGRLEARARQEGDGLFLEGIDLGMAGTEGFEDWLRDRRQEEQGDKVVNIRRPTRPKRP
jgi:hypothetical protein